MAVLFNLVGAEFCPRVPQNSVLFFNFNCSCATINHAKAFSLLSEF